MKNTKKVHDSFKTKTVRTSGIVKRHKPSVGSKTATAGITLIALVVTIVVLLILAGITIQLVLSDGGIFSQAQKSKEQTRIGELLDKFSVSEATVSLEKFGKPTLEDFINQVQDKEGYIEEAEKEDDSHYQVITEDGYVFDVSIIEGTNTNDIIIEYVGKADSMPPKAAIITFSKTETQAEEEITATITHVANSNPIAIENCKWLYNKESSKIGKDSTEWNNENVGSFTNNEQTIDLNTEEGGNFYLHVLSVDTNGAKRETVAGPVTVKPKPAEKFSRANGSIDIAFVDMSNQPISGSNVPTPKLGEGMVPVKWNETDSSWYVCQSTDNEWYSYTEEKKKWANIMLRDGLIVEGITDTSTATIIEMAGKKVTTVGSMFVYIPRYGYKITYTDTNGNIIGYSDNTGITNKSGGIVEGTEKQGAIEVKGTLDGKKIEKYVLHPAFQKFETDELTMANGGWKEEIEGIWVAKFEVSNNGSSVIQVKPGVASWRGISVDDIFTKCSGYDSTLSSHLMKNSEWGAVAYLATSKYGKNGKITKNESISYYTGGGSGTAYISNKAQSTTGNVYGIYDMSGGANEYVASYVDSENSYLTRYGASLVNSSSGHFKQVYSKGSSDSQQLNYEANKGKYGDAIYETSYHYSSTTGSWYVELSIFPSTNSPFFERGGYNVSTSSGVFCFSSGAGIASGSINSFRPVIATPCS